MCLSYGVVITEDAVPLLAPPESLSDGVVSLRLWRREDVPAIVAPSTTRRS